MEAEMECRLISAGEAEHRRRPRKRTSAAEISFRCPVCEKMFASEKYVRMHLGIHRQTAHDIQETEHDVAEKAGHVVVAGNAGFWECAVCGKYFLQASYYRNHMRTHSEERPFVCDLCSIGFKERYHLKKHQLFKHSKEMNEQCKKCGKRFKDSTAVRAHERIHSDARPFACTRCGKAFKTSECLWHHDHRSKACTAVVQYEARGFSTGDSQQELRASATVEKRDIGMGGMSQHLAVSASGLYGPRNFRCESENEMMARAGRNFGFRLSGSKLLTSTPNGNCEHPTLTDDSGKHEGNFEGNLKEETTDWGFSASSSTSNYSACDDVGTPSVAFNISSSNSSSSNNNFTTNRFLGTTSTQDHARRHASERIACARCGKLFASSRAFEKHARMHNELRPHRCAVCDIGFKLKVHLKKHNLYRHNADYPCKCNVCGKGFKDTSAVRLHERIHSSERPFLCQCGKAFKTRENLWGHRHRLKHSLERRTKDETLRQNGTQIDLQSSLSHKTTGSPSDTTEPETPSQAPSVNYRDGGNSRPLRDCYGRDFLKDFVKAEAAGDCDSRVENVNLTDYYGKSCWGRDFECEEAKVVPEQLMTMTSVNDQDDHILMTPAFLRSCDEGKWPNRRDVVGNSLPSFETLISALRSCVGSWQQSAALSPTPANGSGADFSPNRELVETKSNKQLCSNMRCNTRSPCQDYQKRSLR